MLLLPGMDAITKFLAGEIAPGFAAWGRFFFQVILLSPLVYFINRRRPRLRPDQIPRTDWWPHIARGGLIAAATTFFFIGIRYLPLADAFAIFFIEPLIVTLLSALLLGEPIGWRRLSAIGSGFIGALLIIRPAFAEVGWAVLYPFAAAWCFAFYILLTRTLAKHEEPMRLQWLTGLFACLGLSAALLVGNHFQVASLQAAWPNLTQWGWLITIGLIGTVGHGLLVYAYRQVVISLLAPFQYIEIIGATLLGWLIFEDFPDPITWLGVAIIVASGSYVFHREARLARTA